MNEPNDPLSSPCRQDVTEKRTRPPIARRLWRFVGLTWVTLAVIGALLSSGCAIGPGLRSTSTERPGPIVLNWTTASEHESYGYHVYRGRSADGPFERINRELIPAAGTTDVPQHYAYIDDAADIGVEYFYFVESVSLAGERHRLTPIKPFERQTDRKNTAKHSQ